METILRRFDFSANRARSTVLSFTAAGARLTMGFLDDILQHTSILPEEQPPEVFHYTTVEGLLGILRTRRLWATDIGYLNDKSEFIYANEMVREVGSAITTGVEPLLDLAAVLNANLLDHSECYVSCFCEDGDLLSQWRAYSHRGAGYAIGFDLAKLRALSNPDDAGFLLGRVIYDRKEQMSILRGALVPALKPITGTVLRDELLRLINEAAKQAHGMSPEDAKRMIDDTTPAVGQHLMGLLSGPLGDALTRLLATRAFLKFPRFSEEREWRLALIRSRDASDQFGCFEGLLIPRVELDLGPYESLPINRVVIGPNLHPEAARLSVRRFLNSIGLQRVEVEVSPIPLRR
jgi:hypothetical protein